MSDNSVSNKFWDSRRSNNHIKMSSNDPKSIDEDMKTSIWKKALYITATVIGLGILGYGGYKLYPYMPNVFSKNIDSSFQKQNIKIDLFKRPDGKKTVTQQFRLFSEINKIFLPQDARLNAYKDFMDSKIWHSIDLSSYRVTESWQQMYLNWYLKIDNDGKMDPPKFISKSTF